MDSTVKSHINIELNNKLPCIHNINYYFFYKSTPSDMILQ